MKGNSFLSQFMNTFTLNVLHFYSLSPSVYMCAHASSLMCYSSQASEEEALIKIKNLCLLHTNKNGIMEL